MRVYGTADDIVDRLTKLCIQVSTNSKHTCLYRAYIWLGIQRTSSV